MVDSVYSERFICNKIEEAIEFIYFKLLFFFVVGKKWILKKFGERKLSIKEHAL
jgi:hypothetical protein